jgi:hypothetical protein
LSGTDETTREPIAGWIDEIRTFDGWWCDRMRELHRLCAREFGRQNGWTLSKRYFHPMKLIDPKQAPRYGIPDPFDHIECFILNRKPAGVVSHSYGPRDRIERRVLEAGYAMRWLETSWYYPAHASAFVVTRPE